MKTVFAWFLLLSALALPPGMAGQDSPSSPPSDSQSAPIPQPDRPVSWKRLVPGIAQDQRDIWTFPLRLRHKDRWIPVAAVLGVAAGLVALDPYDASYFRRTSAFSGFNRTVSGDNAVYGIIAAPVSLYVLGKARRDPKMAATALLAGEAIVDSEILTTVLKDALRRVRPAAIPPNGDFTDTWFESRGSLLRGDGSMPSGHAIAAFSVATVISRRYGHHRWVPFVAYGLAGVVGFSRITLSAHFVSDVFMGAALGYSISRFTVLHQ